MLTTNKRVVKSFVLRQGKITPGQQNALCKLAHKYMIDYQETPLDLAATFSRDNPKIIEIGFGMGHATLQIAKNSPDNDYLGLEVHSPGVGSLLMFAETHSLTNLRIIKHDAVQVLKHMLADNTIHGFHIYFPDPWPKKRHYKRRLIQTEFISLLSSKLKPGGYIHLATDWEDYAIWMLNILNNNSNLVNTSATNNFIPRPDYRPLTKFEQRGLNLGHKVYDILFTKN